MLTVGSAEVGGTSPPPYLADEDHTVVPRGSEHLARLARPKAVSVGKMADAFEAALAQPVEDE